MEWLNYHHLLYFWVVAKEGSIARASTVLRLAHPTISGQIRALEESLGEELFMKSGRGLVLTEVGKVAFRYADEIFSLGKELTDTLKRRPTGRPLRFVVGIADVVPKIIAHRLLEPALRLGQSIQLVCREDNPESLLADLDPGAILCDLGGAEDQESRGGRDCRGGPEAAFHLNARTGHPQKCAHMLTLMLWSLIVGSAPGSLRRQ